MLGQLSCVARPHQNMETGFSVMRKDSIWVLKMQGTDTEGKFGSLEAAMQSAYLLTDAAIGKDDNNAALAGDL
jgi:hypothetical protein